MRNRLTIWLLFLAVLSLTSCVAKKEYLNMESGRLKAEKQVWDLTNANNSKAQRIQELIADNEKLKGESRESISVKDQEISKLNAQKEEVSMLKKLMSEKDAEILKLNNEINLLKKQLDRKK